ncbi:cell division transport system permease protein [Desulfobaculum xiamenense]|uniref:Cell division protein FtsX n=1 Tax=Desulfobaculum xiamenense TaxID=995050 RepID=A0A846QIB4_9BACT|nr:FtsX-like permease family protein [Desulfobaculum xiamenense]NJB67968.1 cell division transport system permease protein [Desulfobaculum xiamenense]
MIGVILRLVLRGLRDTLRHPLSRLLTLAAVTLAAFLGALFLLVVDNLDRELLDVKGRFAFQVYWEAGADMNGVRTAWAGLQSLPHLVSWQTFTPDEALKDLSRTLSGVGGLDRLGSGNPLPPTALLHFSPPADEADAFARDMLARLQALPGVADVHYDALQIELARSWAVFSRSVLWPVVALLALAVALLVGNTMKLSMLARRDEVAILHLVGAARWYIRLPLVAGGALIGLVAGSLALAFLRGAQVALARFCAAAPLSIDITFLPAEQCVAVVAALTLVCMFSGWVAVRE